MWVVFDVNYVLTYDGGSLMHVYRECSVLPIEDALHVKKGKLVDSRQIFGEGVIPLDPLVPFAALAEMCIEEIVREWCIFPYVMRITVIQTSSKQ